MGSIKNLSLILDTYLVKSKIRLNIYLLSSRNELYPIDFLYLVLDKNALIDIDNSFLYNISLFYMDKFKKIKE